MGEEYTVIKCLACDFHRVFLSSIPIYLCICFIYNTEWALVWTIAVPVDVAAWHSFVERVNTDFQVVQSWIQVLLVDEFEIFLNSSFNYINNSNNDTYI